MWKSSENGFQKSEKKFFFFFRWLVLGQQFLYMEIQREWFQKKSGHKGGVVSCQPSDDITLKINSRQFLTRLVPRSEDSTTQDLPQEELRGSVPASGNIVCVQSIAPVGNVACKTCKYTMGIMLNRHRVLITHMSEYMFAPKQIQAK